MTPSMITSHRSKTQDGSNSEESDDSDKPSIDLSDESYELEK